MKLSAAQRDKINTWRPCSVAGCTKRCRWVLDVCSLHARHRTFYGKPTARRINASAWHPYLPLVRRAFRKALPPDALEAALALMARLLDPGPEPRYQHVGPTKDRYELWRELTRLADPKNAKVRPNNVGPSGDRVRALLEVAMAVWLLSKEQPAVLPDDVRLTMALSNAVFRMAKLPRKGRRRTPRKPRRGALLLFGTAVRETFGLLVYWLERHIEAERQARNRKLAAPKRRRRPRVVTALAPVQVARTTARNTEIPEVPLDTIQ